MRIYHSQVIIFKINFTQGKMHFTSYILKTCISIPYFFFYQTCTLTLLSRDLHMKLKLFPFWVPFIDHIISKLGFQLGGPVCQQGQCPFFGRIRSELRLQLKGRVCQQDQKGQGLLRQLHKIGTRRSGLLARSKRARMTNRDYGPKT